MTVSRYLYQAKLCVEDVPYKIKNWYEDWQRPGEFKKRASAVVPSTLVHLVALSLFTNAAALGLSLTFVSPEAMNRIMHNPVIQDLQWRLRQLNMTETQKKAAIAFEIAIAGLFIQNAYLALIPSAFVVLLIGDMTLDRYYKRT